MERFTNNLFTVNPRGEEIAAGIQVVRDHYPSLLNPFGVFAATGNSPKIENGRVRGGIPANGRPSRNGGYYFCIVCEMMETAKYTVILYRPTPRRFLTMDKAPGPIFELEKPGSFASVQQATIPRRGAETPMAAVARVGRRSAVCVDGSLFFVGHWVYFLDADKKLRRCPLEKFKQHYRQAADRDDPSPLTFGELARPSN